MAVFFSPSVSTRYYFSTYHLWTARHFARLAAEREAGSNPNFDIQHRAYVMNAILSAVAFLEAAINELYDDIIAAHPSYVGHLPDETKQALLDHLKAHKRAERWPTLMKYRETLACADKAAFDEGAQPFEDADLLIKLRNRLMHAHTQTQETRDIDDLGKKLRSRFASHRHISKSANPYFPDHCLSAGCAEWAVKSAKSFTDDFFTRIGVVPNYQGNPFSDVPY